MAEWSELIPVGEKFISQGRTITDGDFSLITSLTWSVGELHTNREKMKEDEFGDMILPGHCVLAIAAGLVSISGTRDVMLTPGGHGVRPVAALGFENVRFLAPVRPGDTLTAEQEILDIRQTRKNPNRGVVRIQMVVYNQRHEVVQDNTRGILLEKTP